MRSAVSRGNGPRRGIFAALVALGLLAAFAAVAGAGGLRLSGLSSLFQYEYGKKPVVQTGAATMVTKRTATLNATVDPEGEAVSNCHFEYGLSASPYEAQVPCASLPGSGTSPVAESVAVKKLAQGATYHFRIVATNPSGTAYGQDQTFFTLTGPPVVHKVTPMFGGVRGGTVVTITGARLAHPTTVYFGKVPATSVTEQSASSITAVSPKAKAGTVDVTVATPSGVSAVTKRDHFTYVQG